MLRVESLRNGRRRRVDGGPEKRHRLFGFSRRETLITERRRGAGQQLASFQVHLRIRMFGDELFKGRDAFVCILDRGRLFELGLVVDDRCRLGCRFWLGLGLGFGFVAAVAVELARSDGFRAPCFALSDLFFVDDLACDFVAAAFFDGVGFAAGFLVDRFVETAVCEIAGENTAARQIVRNMVFIKRRQRPFSSPLVPLQHNVKIIARNCIWHRRAISSSHE
jgi:hypothetical protein